MSSETHPVVGRCRELRHSLRPKIAQFWADAGSAALFSGGAEPNGAGGVTRHMWGTEPSPEQFSKLPDAENHLGSSALVQNPAPPCTRLSPGGWEGPWERAFRGLSSSSGLGSSALGEEGDPGLCSRPGDSLGLGLVPEVLKSKSPDDFTSTPCWEPLPGGRRIFHSLCFCIPCTFSFVQTHTVGSPQWPPRERDSAHRPATRKGVQASAKGACGYQARHAGSGHLLPWTSYCLELALFP